MTATALTINDARTMRCELLRDRIDAGQRVVGRKIALTSPAAQQRVGTDRPIWGWLTDAMELPDGGAVTWRPDLRTRAEPELVFVLGDDLVGPGVTARHVLDATAAVCAGIELPCGPVHATSPTAAQLVAANASSGSFVLGPPVSHWRRLDLALLGVLVEVDGDVVASGAGAAVLGHPARAIAQLANDLAAVDASELRAGELIFSGGLTQPVTLQPGMTVEATFAYLGRIGIRTVGAT